MMSSTWFLVNIHGCNSGIQVLIFTWGGEYSRQNPQYLVGDGSMITPSGPITVVILVANVDYISELTIHSIYAYTFCIKEMYNILFIVNLMQETAQSWY